MPSRWRIRRLWLRIVLAAGVLMLLSLGFGESLRRTTLPTELRFVPREAVVLVALGQIGSLWKTVEAHIGPVMREGEDEGVIVQALRELGDETEVESLEDLEEKFGLDTTRGAVFAGVATHASEGGSLDELMSGFVEDLDWVFVLPVSSREKLLEVADPAEPSECEDLAGVDAYDTGDFRIAFPGDDWAVLAASCETLSKSIVGARENLQHHRARFPLYRAARHLNGPLLQGARVFAFANTAFAGGSVRDVALGLYLNPGAIRLEATAELFDDQVRLVDELLADSPPEAPGRELLDPDSPGAFLVRDAALGRYLRFAWLDDELAAMLDRHFGSLFGSEETAGGVTQVVQALAGYEDGALQGVLGIWAGKPETIDEMVTGSQLRLRERRDRAVLENAARKYREQSDGDGAPVTYAALLEAGLLEEEPDELLSRYPIEAEEWVEIGEVELTAGDLRAEDYRRRYGEAEIRYLAPVFSENDFRRIGVKPSELAENERQEIFGDRGRLASWAGNNVLWVTMDEMDLEALIDRAETQAAPGRDGGPTEPLGAQGGAKAELVFDIQAALDEGELELDQEAWGGMRDYLWDFRLHRTAEATLRPERSERRLHLAVEILK